MDFQDPIREYIINELLKNMVYISLIKKKNIFESKYKIKKEKKIYNNKKLNEQKAAINLEYSKLLDQLNKSLNNNSSPLDSESLLIINKDIENKNKEKKNLTDKIEKEIENNNNDIQNYDSTLKKLNEEINIIGTNKNEKYNDHIYRRFLTNITFIKKKIKNNETEFNDLINTYLKLIDNNYTSNEKIMKYLKFIKNKLYQYVSPMPISDTTLKSSNNYNKLIDIQKDIEKYFDKHEKMDNETYNIFKDTLVKITEPNLEKKRDKLIRRITINKERGREREQREGNDTNSNRQGNDTNSNRQGKGTPKIENQNDGSSTLPTSLLQKYAQNKIALDRANQDKQVILDKELNDSIIADQVKTKTAELKRKESEYKEAIFNKNEERKRLDEKKSEYVTEKRRVTSELAKDQEKMRIKAEQDQKKFEDDKLKSLQEKTNKLTDIINRKDPNEGERENEKEKEREEERKREREREREKEREREREKEGERKEKERERARARDRQIERERERESRERAEREREKEREKERGRERERRERERQRERERERFELLVGDSPAPPLYPLCL